MPETGEVAPERMFVAVRAIAPVTGMPPNKGTARFATPCASSSASGLCRSPLMLSATTAESRLSMAASIATVSAEGNSGIMRSARNSGSAIRGRPVGMPPNLVPIVSTGTANDAAGKGRASSKATIEPGTFFVTRGQTSTTATVAAATTTAGMLIVAALCTSAIIRGKNSLGTALQREAQEVFDLRRGDQHRDAVGEADRHRPRNEPHGRAEAREPHENEHRARHGGAHQQAGDAKLGDDSRHNDDKSAGRAGDLAARAAKRRDDESRRRLPCRCRLPA